MAEIKSRVKMQLQFLGITAGGAADILFDKNAQQKLVNEAGINLKKSEFKQYKCIIVRNRGSRSFRSPIVGYSSKAKMEGVSLQVGIFSLLQFGNVLPLLPKMHTSNPDGVRLRLFEVPKKAFDLKKLSKIYKVDDVYEDFIRMDEIHKTSQAKFLAEFKRKKGIAKKAAAQCQKSSDEIENLEPNVILEEIFDKELLSQFSKMSGFSALRDSLDSLDPWASPRKRMV